MNTNHEHRVCIGLDAGGYDQCLRSIQLLIVGEQVMTDKVPTKYISNILGIGNKFERTKKGALEYAAVSRDDRRLSTVDKE